ncbi:hypothetical protein BGZ73_003135 [Actinomortierella ambigua]|nr:hypothetical protein BGZ73_003135 [Actinomortierella ambigua]
MVYPVYASYKTIKSRNNMRLQAWLMYWTVLSLYTIAEPFADLLFFWFPFYYDIKMLFVLWMVLPQTQGSLYIYQVFVEPYLISHEQDIDKKLQDVQKQAKALGSDYIKRGIAAVQKFVLDTLSKATGGSQPSASSEHVQAATAAPGPEKTGDSQTAPTAGGSGYFSWAYSMVSPKLSAVATMASQKVSRQLPSRPLPRPPINLYSATSESGTDPISGHASSSSSSSMDSKSFWSGLSRQPRSVDPSEADSHSSGLGITPPVSPEDQKRLDNLSNHLETAAGYITRTYMASSSSSNSGASGASTTGANLTASVTSADVRRRMLSLYGEESDNE